MWLPRVFRCGRHGLKCEDVNKKNFEPQEGSYDGNRWKYEIAKARLWVKARRAK
jgi:hypothetical protein